MITTVVVAQHDEPLLPLALVKQHLRLDADDTSQDLVLSTMVDTAAGLIDGPDGWLGRALRRQTLELHAPRFPCAACACGSPALIAFAYDFAALSTGFDGDYAAYRSDTSLAMSNAILLSCPPIACVEAICYRDTSGAVRTLDPSAYRLFGRALLPVYGTGWPPTLGGPGAVTIRYLAGYGFPGLTDPLPPVARSAMLLIIGSLYEGREAKEVDLYGSTVERLLQPIRVYV